MEDGSERNWEDRSIFQYFSSYCDRKEKNQNGTFQIPRPVRKISYSWLPPIAWKDLWTFFLVWTDTFLVLDIIHVSGILQGDSCSGQWKTQARHCNLEITFCQHWDQAKRCLSCVLFVSESVASPMVMTSLKKDGNPGKGGYLIWTISACYSSKCLWK